MSKEKQAAQEILKHIGGQENILSVEHCATRLRLVLKDASEFDKKEIEAIDGVKGSFFVSGQHQIILSIGFVNKVYQQMLEITGMNTEKVMSRAEVAAVGMNAVQKASRLLGDVFFPIIPILAATELFMGLRSLITNLGVELNPTFLTLLQVLIGTAFSFLSALVTYSVMKRFGASPALGTMIDLMLVAPQLPNANQVVGGSVEPIYLSLTGLNIPIIGYQGSVLPALILGVIVARIEKGLGKIVPGVLDLIVAPFITLLSSLFIGLIAIGPIMHMVEQGSMVLISVLMNIPFDIGDFMAGALQQAVVITGLYHTFKALEIELLVGTGANPFNALVCGAIVAQGAAGTAAVLKTKSKEQRFLYFTSAIPAFLGITEPSIFGGNLPRLTPFTCGCIGDGCTEVFSSIVGLAGTDMSITALPGMLLHLNGQLGTYLIACLIGFITALVLNYVMYKPVRG